MHGVGGASVQSESSQGTSTLAGRRQQVGVMFSPAGAGRGRGRGRGGRGRGNAPARGVAEEAARQEERRKAELAAEEEARKKERADDAARAAATNAAAPASGVGDAVTGAAAAAAEMAQLTAVVEASEGGTATDSAGSQSSFRNLLFGSREGDVPGGGEVPREEGGEEHAIEEEAEALIASLRSSSGGGAPAVGDVHPEGTGGAEAPDSPTGGPRDGGAAFTTPPREGGGDAAIGDGEEGGDPGRASWTPRRLLEVAGLGSPSGMETLRPGGSAVVGRRASADVYSAASVAAPTAIEGDATEEASAVRARDSLGSGGSVHDFDPDADLGAPYREDRYGGTGLGGSSTDAGDSDDHLVRSGVVAHIAAAKAQRASGDRAASEGDEVARQGRAALLRLHSYKEKRGSQVDGGDDEVVDPDLAAIASDFDQKLARAVDGDAGTAAGEAAAAEGETVEDLVDYLADLGGSSDGHESGRESEGGGEAAAEVDVEHMQAEIRRLQEENRRQKKQLAVLGKEMGPQAGAAAASASAEGGGVARDARALRRQSSRVGQPHPLRTSASRRRLEEQESEAAVALTEAERDELNFLRAGYAAVQRQYEGLLQGHLRQDAEGFASHVGDTRADFEKLENFKKAVEHITEMHDESRARVYRAVSRIIGRNLALNGRSVDELDPIDILLRELIDISGSEQEKSSGIER